MRKSTMYDDDLTFTKKNCSNLGNLGDVTSMVGLGKRILKLYEFVTQLI